MKRNSIKKSQWDYHIVTSHIVMAGDLNGAMMLFGGAPIQWVDEAAALYSMEILKSRRVVTKKISEVIFNNPAKLGDVLDLLFRLKAVGRTSLTLSCLVQTKKLGHDEAIKEILECDLVFVNIDDKGRPTPHHLSAEH